MQRRGGLLSPVPDVGQEQEQSHAPYRYNETMPLPTMLPPAPSVQPGHSPQSRMYRALPPGMGAVPAAHDLPTQFPARPSGYGNSWARSQSIGNNQPQAQQSQQQQMHVPARPFVDPVAGPLPAADFSFGAPEPGHGDAFTRVMGQEGMDVERSPVGASPPNGEFQANGDFGAQSNGEFAAPSNPNNAGEYNANSGEYSNEYNSGNATEYAPPMWDARTRFGSMASIASDVTGVSVSSTQATSVSGGLGTAGFGNGADCETAFGNGFNGDARFGGDSRGLGHGYTLSAGYPSGFQPDLRRASCPGEFLHQFSGMGVNNGSSGNLNGNNASGGNEGGSRSTSLTHLRPSMLGRSLTLAADAQLPSPSSNQHHHQAQNQNHVQSSNQNSRGLTISSEGHRGVNLALEAKSLRSPTFPPGQVDPTYPPPPPGLSVGAGGGPFAPRENGDQQQQHMGHSMGHGGQHMNSAGQHMNQPSLSPAQRALVGGGFGSDPTYPMNLPSGYDAHSGFETHTPPSFEASPNMGGGVDGMGVGVVDGMNMGGVGMNVHGSSGKGSPMLFTGVGVEGEPMFGMNTMSPDSLAMAMIGQEYGMPGGFSFP